MFSQGCTSKNSKLLTLFKHIAHVSNQNFNLANTCMQKALFCTRAVGNPVISKFKVYLISTTRRPSTLVGYLNGSMHFYVGQKLNMYNDAVTLFSPFNFLGRID